MGTEAFSVAIAVSTMETMVSRLAIAVSSVAIAGLIFAIAIASMEIAMATLLSRWEASYRAGQTVEAAVLMLAIAMAT
jgi:hypothetical protein